MTTTALPAVGLLERAVGYARGALADVTPTDLARPTPCPAWDLQRLLLHMDDGLRAFTEAGDGFVATRSDGRPDSERPLLERLREQACALLGAWSRPGHAVPATVAVGDRSLAADLLVGAAALEITLHGWDVSQALGRAAPVPEGLARHLLATARILIGPDDRPARFGPPLPTAEAASAGERLLALSGRPPTGGIVPFCR